MAVIQALEKKEFFTREDFINSYDVGERFKFLRIHSAYDKGRKDNRRRPLREALNFPYIQPNSDFNISWLVFDVDRDFNVCEIYEKNLSVPNFIVVNKENNHAQIWYKLKDPIWLQQKYKEGRAFRYYKAIYEALRGVLDADRHFNRALCKNPFFYADDDKNKKWVRLDFTRREYSLLELCNHLDLNYNSFPGKKGNVSIDREDVELFFGAEKGSRNSSLFDHCRAAAYRYFARSNCSESDLLEWTESYVNLQNENNNPPLEPKECECMAKSIAAWTFSNIQPRRNIKVKYDDKAREKSLRTRVSKKNKKIGKVKRLLRKNPGVTNREISRRLGFSLSCVNSYVLEIKKQEQALRNAKENKKAKRANAEQSRFFNPEQKMLNERFVNQFVCRAIDLNRVDDKRHFKVGEIPTLKISNLRND